MPHATKDAPARPFDVADAVRRAARCRALRERAGLNLEGLAELAGVTVRSVSRWESPDGRGSCPDDVLEALESLLDRQAALVGVAMSRAVEAAEAVAGRVGSAGGGGGPKPGLNPGGLGAAPGGPDGGADGPCGGPSKADSMPGGAAAGRFDAGGGARGLDSMPGGAADSMPCDPMPCGAMPCDSMPSVMLLYYPTQRVYDECHPKDGGYYGIANANARAAAQELERLGFSIDWRFATPELVSSFEYDLL